MTQKTNEQSFVMSNRQRLFIRYTLAILVDLTILNLFNEYWDYFYIEYFSISLLAAILLQFLLQLTMKIEHRVASHFKKSTGIKAKIQRGLSTWGIIFISKLVILEIINLVCGDSLIFSGPVHGVVAFIVVVTVIIAVEELIIRVHRSLA